MRRAHPGEPLPPHFGKYPSFVAHSYLAWLLMGLIALHVLDALYHQFVRKDGVLRRMLFGKGMIEAFASKPLSTTSRWASK